MPKSTANGSRRRWPTVRAGFLPLIDSAILLIAREKAFDHAQGFELALSREESWTSMRDRMQQAAYDCAHMSAGTPLAMRLGLGSPPSPEPVFVPFAMGRGGTAIVLSKGLAQALARVHPDAMGRGGMAAAHAIRALLHSPEHAMRSIFSARSRVGEAPLALSIPYPYASHNYDLRYWLAHAGVDPGREVSIVTMARGHMLQALQSGRIQGFIIAEPWCSMAVHEGLGHIVATKSQLWPDGPEKVLGVRERWAEANPDLLTSLIRGLDAAARWLDRPENRAEAARILSRRTYLGLPQKIIAEALAGCIKRQPDAPPVRDESYFVFHKNAANFPWRSHATWMLTQMVRWGDIKRPIAFQEIAAQAWRPDIYRDALAGISGLEVPAENLRPEQHRGGFFAGRRFDPGDPRGYLASFKLHARGVPATIADPDGEEEGLG